MELHIFQKIEKKITMWAALERKIRLRKKKPKNQNEFFMTLEQEFYNLDIGYLNKLSIVC